MDRKNKVWLITLIILLIAAEHFMGGFKEKLIFNASRKKNKEGA